MRKMPKFTNEKIGIKGVRLKMTESLKNRVSAMKKLEIVLEKQLNNGVLNWEEHCGYSIDSELYSFINLTAEELQYV